MSVRGAIAGLMLSALPALAAASIFAAEPDARSLYNAKCANCHGRGGKARPDLAKKNAPNFNDPAWQKQTTDAEIRDVIAKGVGETGMKAFAPELSAAEIDAVATYVRSLAAPPAK